MIKETANKFSDVLLDQASDWFAKLTSNLASAQDYIEFSKWLAEDPQHEAAYHEIETLWERLEIIKTLPVKNEKTFTFLQNIKEKYNHYIDSLNPYLRWSYITAFLVFFVSITLLMTINHLNPGEIYSTQPGEQKQILLPDGSTILLNTHSKIKVKYTETSREIYLEYGEALFDVVTDENRPFTVKSGDITANAVGTLFSVYRKCENDYDTIITVIEGAVQVIDKNTVQTNSDNASKFLQASQQARYNQQGIGKTELVNTHLVTSWTQQKLIYDGIPLSHVLEDLNRYTNSTIKVADESLNQIPVSAVFRLQDQEALLKTLEQAFGLKAIHVSKHLILLDKAQFYE